MKKIITLFGLVLLSHTGHVCADSADISSFLDSDCDNYFDNQTGFIVSPEKKMQDTDFINFVVAYITHDEVIQPSLQHFMKGRMGKLRQVNLYCFTIPKVIEAKVNLGQDALKMAELPLPSSPTTNGAAMCCFVSYPFEKLVITT